MHVNIVRISVTNRKFNNSTTVIYFSFQIKYMRAVIVPHVDKITLEQCYYYLH